MKSYVSKYKVISLIILSYIGIQIAYSLYSLEIMGKISSYRDINGFIFEKIIPIIIWLFFISKILDYFFNANVVIRYKTIEEYSREMVKSLLKNGLIVIGLMNIYPFFIFLRYYFNLNEAYGILFNLVFQYLSFIMIGMLFLCIKLYVKNNILIYLTFLTSIYAPTYLFKVFNLNELTPINFILIYNNSEYLRIKINLIFILVFILVYIILFWIKKIVSKNIIWGE